MRRRRLLIDSGWLATMACLQAPVCCDVGRGAARKGLEKFVIVAVCCTLPALWKQIVVSACGAHPRGILEWTKSRRAIGFV